MNRVLVAAAGVLLLAACERAQRAYDAFRTPVGEAYQVVVVEDEREGHLERGTYEVMRLPYGGTARGRIVNGEREGHWVMRDTDGTILDEGPYVNGKMEGQWVIRFPTGSV